MVLHVDDAKASIESVEKGLVATFDAPARLLFAISFKCVPDAGCNFLDESKLVLPPVPHLGVVEEQDGHELARFDDRHVNE